MMSRDRFFSETQPLIRKKRNQLRCEEQEHNVNRLQKFVEKGSYGEGRGRTAYILDPEALPPSTDGMEWQRVDTFNAGDELLKHPGLKEVFKAAIDKGVAMIAAPARLDPLH
jgi:hypothetical protein